MAAEDIGGLFAAALEARPAFKQVRVYVRMCGGQAGLQAGVCVCICVEARPAFKQVRVCAYVWRQDPSSSSCVCVFVSVCWLVHELWVIKLVNE